jgi:transposase
MKLTLAERVELVLLYGKANGSQREAIDLFQAAHPNRPMPSQSAVSKLVKKFKDTGSVADKRKSGRRRTATGDKSCSKTIATVGVCGRTSVRDLAKRLRISRSTVHRILTRHKFKPYKLQFHQILEKGDHDRRSEFCEQFHELLSADPDLIFRICFSDECTFQIDGRITPHNHRFWCENNPRWMRENHNQYSRKVNVWCGIFGKRIVGPFFIEGTLDAATYLDLLINEIGPALSAVCGDKDVWFQQDGAPPHFGSEVRQFLNETFPDRWIGRSGPIPWPARSPDLSPLDFFLWGYVRERVFVTAPRDIDDLKERVRSTLSAVKRSTLKKVLREFTNRLGYCIAAQGRHFEHLI